MEFLIWFYALAIIQIVITGHLCKMEWRRESPFLLFWGALLLVYLLPSLTDPFNSDAAANAFAVSVKLTGNPALLKAQVFYIGFALVYWSWRQSVSEPLYRGTRASLLAAVRRPVPPLESSLIVVATLVALLCMLASVDFSVSTLLRGTYTSYRLESNTPLKLVANFIVIGSGGSVFLFWKTGQRRYAMVVLTAIAMIFFASRTRQILVPIILPVVFFVALNARGIVGTIKTGVAGVGLVLFFGLLQVFRYAPTLKDGFRLLFSGELFNQFAIRFAASQGEAALRFPYYYFLGHTQFDGFGHGLTYQRLLLFWLPSAVSGGIKPADFDEILYSQYYAGDFTAVAGTLHILFPGSAYANFGWFGMVLGIPLAWTAARLNWWLHSADHHRAMLVLGPSCFAALMLARGSVYNTCMMFLVSTFIVWIIFTTGDLIRRATAARRSLTPAFAASGSEPIEVIERQ